MAVGVRARGWECVIALARPLPELADFYESLGFETIAAPDLVCWDHSTVAPRRLTNMRHVADLARVRRRWNQGQAATMRLIETVKPDVTHLNSMPLSNAAVALTRAGVPFVWHVREPPPDDGYRTRIIRAIMQQAPACVFISEHDRQEWLAGPGGQIIYNSVPDEWFKPGHSGHPSARMEGGPQTFVFAGGLAVIKGAHVLCDALEQLAAKRSDWVCVMPAALGEPPRKSFRTSLKALAAKLGVQTPSAALMTRLRSLGDRVRLLPFQREMRPILETAAFVVFPAAVPHFARPIIEAAALGVPAIGSDLGGVRECIDDGLTGLLCEPNDAVALCRSIERMLDDPEMRATLGRNAAIRAGERYTVSMQIEKIVKLYDDCLRQQLVGSALEYAAP